MQVVEKLNEGLSRVLEVKVAKDILASKLDAKIKDVAPKMNIKGFRPGKVPAAHIKKMYGRELFGEIIQETLNETSQKAMDDANIRPASQPELKPVGDWEKVMSGSEDLAYELSVEMMPEFTPVKIEDIKLDRPTYAPTEKDIDEAVETIISQTQQFEPKTGKTVKAAKGDKLIIDFKGTIDGVAFEGGTAEAATLIIGSGQFIPGFEDQLIGAKADETRTLDVTFPADYGAADLAGKAAQFETKVKEILSPKKVEADDELAKSFGLESLQALRDLMKTQLENQYASAARFKMKRQLLDSLDAAHSFQLPSKMLEAEFAGIWTQVEEDKKVGQLSDEDKARTDDELKAEYRKIAERRVRLGLVLAEIGTQNKVGVSDQEVNQAIMAEARNYPGQERQIFEYYRQNPQAAAQIRAPLYEEKVCDLIFTLAKITDKDVKKDELLEDDED